MSSTRLFFACLALLSIGCDNATNIGPLVPFTRPEHLAAACFAPRTGDANKAFELLPQLCCQPPNRSDSLCSRAPDGAPLGGAHLHALITQSTRGEVAAVDTTLDSDERVLDSDSLIPGYTFLDSGGLPSAIVVPPRKPRATGSAVGAPYTFVASAEEYQIRALPTCRFRSGRACGPELVPPAAGELPLAERLKLPLPAAPGDMILGPDDALWVTLPELGLIARVELADPANASDAFARDPETSRPQQPQFFRVPAPADVAPAEPVAEVDPYVEVCGTERPFVPSTDDLPIAPRAPMRPVRPTHLRFDAASGLLLVDDADAPVLHAFTLDEEGALTAIAALPTGAPMRAFALTNPVPAQVTRGENNAPRAPTAAEERDLPTRRYLYGIDDRDGSLMLFEFVEDAPALVPLRAPVPNGRFADRIELPTPSAALDVVDTRKISSTSCNSPIPPGLNETDTKAAEAERARLKVDAASNYLRGVFVVVASESGTVSVLDVHDLDLACRTERECDYPNGKPATPLRADLRSGVAVRRHATRRSFATGVGVTVTNDVLLAERDGCEAFTPLYPTTEAPRTRLCVPSDPWRTNTDGWSVQYRPILPGTVSRSGVLSVESAAPDAPAADELVLRAPAGLDLCGRGVLPGDRVVLSSAEQGSSSRDDTCGALGGTDSDSESNQLSVRAAYRDRLIIQTQGRRQELLDCYPDFVAFDVRAKDYLVAGQVNGVALHNVIAAEDDGACVVDPQRPRNTSRVAPGQVFTNPYLSFQLTENAGQVPTTGGSRNVSVQLRDGSGPLSLSLVRSEFADVLPATVRYLPDEDQLFVVDSASQGLQRILLNPFGRDSN